MPQQQLPRFDLRSIPFSMRGAWFDLSPVVALHTTAEHVHLVSHRTGMHGVLRLVPQRGAAEQAVELEADPSRLVWRAADGGTVEAVFDGPEVLRLRGHGLALQLSDAAPELTPFTGTYLFVEPADGAAVFASYETGRRIRITSLAGRLRVVGAEALGQSERSVVVGDDDAPWEVAVEEIGTAAAPLTAARGFDEAHAAAAAQFTDFLDAVAPWRGSSTPAAALACYVIWSATVAPEGFLGGETVLMSKHWMDKLWSWDHCFTAIALAPGDPELALAQYFGPFEHQEPSGALPDSVTHSEVLRNFVKPPIHGWALRRLRHVLARPLTRDELERCHRVLAAWSTFWLTARRAPGHRVPHYQHGNDSGWDNATTFDADRVVESPDLAAFLAVQLDVVAELSEELGLPAQQWVSARDEQLDALLTELWTADGFVAVGVHTGRPSTTTSLLTQLPIVLGDRLPAAVRARLAARIAEHLTAHGPATELPTSPHYLADGYWRGPIWAPSTALVEDGLRRAGHLGLADRVSERFRALCERSGFAENFDALTGEGLRDKAYTWTAAVYLTFARDHLLRHAEQESGTGLRSAPPGEQDGVRTTPVAGRSA